MGSEETTYLQAIAGVISLQGLLLAGIVLAASGDSQSTDAPLAGSKDRRRSSLMEQIRAIAPPGSLAGRSSNLRSPTPLQLRGTTSGADSARWVLGWLTPRGCGFAVVAFAVEDDFVSGDGVADVVFDLAEDAFELGVAEGFDAAAVVADDVVVVLAALVAGFVADVTAAYVDALREAVLDEEVEDAVHACDPDTLPFCAQPVEDLHRCEAAGLAAEQLDDREASSASSEAFRVQAGDGVFGPVRLL
jgi:hypothetical protein